MIIQAGVFWSEISGNYNSQTGDDLAVQDQATFLNAVYSYFVSHTNEFRGDARKNMLDYLSGALDDEKVEDERPIYEQVPDMLDMWDQFDAELAAPTAPTTE